ncbi:WhiB family transcriptional regulator [Nocardia sp. NPDC059239]|uniref:WhiB family transcriptional regulator n=1 Tax=unclassified Nocardia TaxID=2637762 RepID=UPI0036B94A3C
MWRDYAACAGAPTEAFFPPGRSTNRRRQALVQRLIQVCEGCPVRRRCAQAAVDNGVSHGIFAGVDLGDGVNRRTLHYRRTKLRRVAEAAA